MYKWVYDRMVEEYKKEEKIDLINKIMSYSNIEVSDRCFANECCSGSAIYNIDTLFEHLKDGMLQSGCNGETVKKIKNALASWEYIKRELAEMRRDTRVSEEERGFKKRVSEVKEPYDDI